MVNCCAVGCQSRTGKRYKVPKTGFFRFPPTNDPRFEQWCKAVRRRSSNGKLWKPVRRHNAFLCSKHFTADQFMPWFDGQSNHRLKGTALPTIFDYGQVDQQKVEKLRPVEHLENIDRSSIMTTAKNVIATADVNDVYHDHHYQPSQADITKRMKELEDENESLRRRLNNAQNETCRKKRRISCLTQQLQRSKDERRNIQEELKLYKNMDLSTFQRKDHMYSDQLKELAMKLMACSTKAYRLVREEFRPMGLLFPSIRTISNWNAYSSSEVVNTTNQDRETEEYKSGSGTAVSEHIDGADVSIFESGPVVEDTNVEVIFVNAEDAQNVNNCNETENDSSVCVFDLESDSVIPWDQMIAFQ